MNTNRDADLDLLLAGLGAARPAASDALMARIAADAAAVQHEMAAMRAAPRRPAATLRPSLWRRIVAAAGGGRVVAGLGTAAVAGLVLGFAQPAPLATLTTAFWGQGLDISVDLLAETDDFVAEG